MKAMRVTSEGAHKETVTYVQFPYERAGDEQFICTRGAQRNVSFFLAKNVSKKLLTWKKKNVSSTVGYLVSLFSVFLA